MPKQDVAFEIFYDGAWHDLIANDDVLTRAPIVIRRGQGDASSAPRPATITATLANDDDMFRTSNPESPLYGKAGRNTPARVSVGGNVRGIVEASSWVCDQTDDFRRYPRRGSAWTEFQGGALLQRIGTWTQPLKSVFRTFNETITGSIGYFPAEQARGATQLLSTVPGTTIEGDGGGFTRFEFDSQSRPPSSAPLMDVLDGAALGIFFAGAQSATATDGWQLSWVARYEPLPAGGGEQSIMYWQAGDGTAYGLVLDGDTGQILIYSSKNGVAVLANGVSDSGYDWTQWTLFSIDADYSAPNTTVWINWASADGTASGFMNASFADVPATLTWWSVLGGDGEIPAGSTIGHIIGMPASSGGGTDLFSASRIDAWHGYPDEIVAIRFETLCDAAGIPYYVSDGWASSPVMGPQPIAPFAEQLREFAATDDGLIYDHRSELRLFFLHRVDRYNRTPAVDLVPEDLPALPREVTDDVPVHNIVTVANRDGGDYTAVDATGPLGTAPPPDGAGEYEQTVAVNIADETDLPQLANWWLRKGTVNLPRYPQVTVNLAALSPAKLAQVEAVDVGSVITISGFREYTIRLQVLGYTETIGTHSRKIVFNCVPDQQFDTGRYNSGRRYDLRTATLTAAAGPTATTLTIGITADEAWSQTSAYNLLISGELVGVPAGGMGARTGTLGAYTQTLTGAVRSKNGVRKTLPAGAAVRVSTPGRWAR